MNTNETKETKEMLEMLIQKQIADLEDFVAGTDEHTKAVADLAKLYNLLNEQEKIELESYDKFEQRLATERQAEADRDQRDRHHKITTWLQIAGFTGTAIASVVDWKLVIKGFKFEETGVWASRSMRELTGKIFRRLR